MRICCPLFILLQNVKSDEVQQTINGECVLIYHICYSNQCNSFILCICIQRRMFCLTYFTVSCEGTCVTGCKTTWSYPWKKIFKMWQFIKIIGGIFHNCHLIEIFASKLIFIYNIASITIHIFMFLQIVKWHLWFVNTMITFYEVGKWVCNNIMADFYSRPLKRFHVSLTWVFPLMER